jgi:CHAD domain-containing protein
MPAETAMSRPRKSAGIAAGRSRPAATPRLNAMMACDTAFRIVARRYLGDLSENHEATCKGDPIALHQMRIALTRLRTAILFFSPMVADSKRAQIRHELKWLNAHLGTVRDLDVAIERLMAINKEQPAAVRDYPSWKEKRADGHRHLARVLRSVRYRRLVKDTSDWIGSGPWSIRRGKRAAGERALPIGTYSADKLTRWQQKLLKRGRKLLKMDVEQRHRLRLLNKKLTYSIDCFEELFSDRRFSRLKTALKHLRKAQKSLGLLNDDANAHSLAAALQRDGADAPMHFLSARREKRLLRTAANAYRKLAK